MVEVSDARTTTTLLDRLRADNDETAWREIDSRFRPVVLAVAQRLGLDDADAADVAQETMAQLFADYRAGKYARERGGLRAWVIGIARHRIADVRRRQAMRRERRGTSALVDLPEHAQLSQIWDAEAERSVLGRALAELARSGKVTARTLEAFRLNVIEQRPVDEVARRLDTTARAVYLAKHRCLRRLQSIVQRLSTAFELVQTQTTG